jgi:hypothetical protein
MHTFSPSPDWSDLFFGTLFALQRPCANKTPWRSKKEDAIWFNSGSTILTHIARACGNDLGTRLPTMWFPDYFCNSATRGLRGIGAEVRYYPITSALEPNWPAIEDVLKHQAPPDVFLLVHYFGKAADATRAAAFCKNTGALLIEDAAHALIAHGDMGCLGDGIFYCPHKVLAAPDGAILVHRHPLLTTSALDEQQRGDVPSTWLTKRIVQKLLPAAAMRYRVRQLPGFPIDLPGEPLDLQVSASSIGQSLINRYADRLTAIATNRKRAAASWRAAFKAHGGPYIAFFSEEEEGPVPYRFIVKCPDKTMAMRLFDAFRAEGVAVESWPDLAPEIQTNSVGHQEAFRLRDTLLFLPVFQVRPATVEPVVRRCLQITQRI